MIGKSIAHHATRVALLALAAFLLLGGPEPATAADVQKIVPPGRQATEVARSTNAITVTMQPSRGSAGVIEVKSDPASNAKQYVLEYLPPDGAASFTDSLRYTDGSGDNTITITSGAAVPSDAAYDVSFKALFVLFVLALLVEQGLALLFNWRPFLLMFDGRGVRTVISLAFSWLFVHGFGLDIVTTLVNVYSGTPHASGEMGKLLTAMIVAGGSSGVNTLLIALGFRSVKTADQIVAKPQRTEGWIAVKLVRKAAVGRVTVRMGDPAAGALPVAGTITGDKSPESIWAYVFPDPMRFPRIAGRSMPANAPCKVTLEGVDSTGKPLTVDWGPYPVAPGAIIDIELAL